MSEEATAGGELTKIAEMGEALFRAQEAVNLKRAELKKAERVLAQLQEVDIPEYMTEIGLTKFETNDVSVEIKESIQVSPLKANRPKVMQVVTDAGDANLIKDTISFMFTRGQHEEADEFYTQAIEKGQAPKREQKIESATLRAYVINKLKNGEEVDVDLFGVRTLKKAVFVKGAPIEPVFE